MSGTASLLNAGSQTGAVIQPMSGGGGKVKDVKIFGVPYKLRDQSDISGEEVKVFNDDERAILAVFGVKVEADGFEAENGRRILGAIYEAGCADDVSVATAGKCGPVAALLMGVAVEALNKMKGMEFVSASRMEPAETMTSSGEFIYITMRVPISVIKTTISVLPAANSTNAANAANVANSAANSTNSANAANSTNAANAANSTNAANAANSTNAANAANSTNAANAANSTNAANAANSTNAANAANSANATDGANEANSPAPPPLRLSANNLNELNRQSDGILSRNAEYVTISKQKIDSLKKEINRIIQHYNLVSTNTQLKGKLEDLISIIHIGAENNDRKPIQIKDIQKIISDLHTTEFDPFSDVTNDLNKLQNEFKKLIGEPTTGGTRTTRRRLRGGNGLQVKFEDQQTKTSS